VAHGGLPRGRRPQRARLGGIHSAAGAQNAASNMQSFRAPNAREHVMEHLFVLIRDILGWLDVDIPCATGA